MNGIFILPTGIGCRIGGDAGDATPAARMIAQSCDRLIVNPNVVNASDINEMTPNMWYVEGSAIDRFISGQIRLKEPRPNRILVVGNEARGDTVNAINAARHTLGADIKFLKLKSPLEMEGWIKDGRAWGRTQNVDDLIRQVGFESFDALAIHSPIDVDKEVAMHYFLKGGINPWGGVEAIVSNKVGYEITKPVAHAPAEREEVISDAEMMQLYRLPSRSRQAAEILSTAYLHCVIKGLFMAPRLTAGDGFGVNDFDFLISPDCWSKPHRHALENGLKVIVVTGNGTNAKAPRGIDGVHYAKSYLEASGYVNCLRSGVLTKFVS